MYVTRPLSLYRKSPEATRMPPPEGPNSGYLVIFDEELEAEATYCWGSCKHSRIRHLPFPQNKILTVKYTERGQSGKIYTDKVLFIPVMDQRLSSNRYYVIKAQGKYTGLACTCSNEEDGGACCFSNYVKNAKPRPLDQMNVYQQFEIFRWRRGYFVAKSIFDDGLPPEFLRRKGWKVHISTRRNYHLSEAHGLNVSLRLRLPDFSFPISDKLSSTTVIGKWYCPFVLVKEKISLKDQMNKSIYYEMTLEQGWEQIYACENDGQYGNAVTMNLSMRTEVVWISTEKAVEEERSVVDGLRWFRTPKQDGGRGLKVGLSLAILERMKWEELRGGWIEGLEGEMRVERVEEFEGSEGVWNRFGCYVLVERFVLRRLDGTVVITFDFRHTNKIKCKWED